MANLHIFRSTSRAQLNRHVREEHDDDEEDGDWKMDFIKNENDYE